MNTELKVNDFICAKYKFGCIQGVIVKVNKNVVVIRKYNQNYTTYISTDTLVNVTKKTISHIGLNENETLINK
jgi:hypothetical protein